MASITSTPVSSTPGGATTTFLGNTIPISDLGPIVNPAFGVSSPISPTNPEYPTLVNDLFSSIDTGAESLGQAAANTALATGDTEEANDYTSAQAIANANATLALAAGKVEQAQTGLQVRQTIGTQQAAQAANGFGSSGSALAMLQASTRQGLLQQQIVGMNAQSEAAGFQEQAAAAGGEGAAATAAAGSASALSASETAIGSAAKTTAINEASALGASIPGLSDLSGTSVPSIPSSVFSGTSTTPTLLGGIEVSPTQPFVI